MAVSAGDRSQQFVKDWVDAYLKHWTKQATRLGAGKYDEREARTFASDQGPLLDVAQQRCKEEESTKPKWKLGALPRTMNVRDADAAPDCRNSVFGPVLFLHQKKYVRGMNGRHMTSKLVFILKQKNVNILQHSEQFWLIH